MQSTFSRSQVLHVTGILDTSFRLYREHFWTYLAIVMIVEIPALMMLGIFLNINGTELFTIQHAFLTARWNVILPFLFQQISALQPIGIFSLLVLAVILQIHTGMVINATAQIYHTGSTSVAQAYRVPIVPIIIIGVLGLSGSIVVMVSLSITCFLFPTIILTLPVICIYQIILLENPNPIKAIARNWKLIQGSILWIMGLLLILFMLNQVFYLIPTSLAAYTLVFIRPGDSSIWGIWGIITLTYIISLLFLSFSTIVCTLLYFKLRVHREGYDLELQSQQQFTDS